MNKKGICLILAAVVSVCAVFCLIAAIRVATVAVKSGGTMPAGMITLTIVTAFCAFMIWKGVRQMD